MIAPFIETMLISLLKAGALWSLATILGSVTGSTILFATGDSPIETPWYESPVFAAALTAVITVFGARMYDTWSKRKESKRQREDKLGTNQITMEELTQKEWYNLLDQIKKQHATETKYLTRLHLDKRVESFQLREEKHQALNECERLNAIIFQISLLLTKHDIEVPEYKRRSYEDIMTGVDEKVTVYREMLNREYLETKDMMKTLT